MCTGRYRVVHSSRFSRRAMCSGLAGCPQPSQARGFPAVIALPNVVQTWRKCKPCWTVPAAQRIPVGNEIEGLRGNRRVRREFCPQAPLQFLAHFHAKLRWDIRFKWKAAIPVATVQALSSFKCDSVAMGAPQDKSLDSLLKNPTGPVFNTQFQLAINTAFQSPGTVNRIDEDTRFGVIPNDFFQ